jgi:hypothetical protein
MVDYHGNVMLLDRHGSAATASLMCCEHPDDEPVLHPVRQVRRAGRFLFEPFCGHAAQLSTNAATDVSTTSAASTALVASIGSAACSVTVGPYGYATTVVATASGQWSFNTGANADNVQVFEVVSDLSPTTSQQYKVLFTQTANVAANSTQVGSFADEKTYSLAAGATITLYVNAYFTRGSSTSSATLSDVTLKAEVIKR